MPGTHSHTAVAIIPARLGSTRFPAKALADETGKPMVVHVCEQASKARSVSRVVVATDAEEIKSAVESHGFQAVMTDPAHTNGTSRLAEAARTLGLKPSQIIVNVQGDEPEIEPETIDASIGALCPFNEPGVNSVGTVVAPIMLDEDYENPNIVKAVMAGHHHSQHAEWGVALYFSRSPIPYRREPPTLPAYRHIGIYAYTVESINAYLAWEPSPLERTESLEQLRWFEHNYQIRAAYTSSAHAGIDTPEQYRSFVERFRAANPPV